MTDDDRIFYPLAADGEVEMEEWMNILTRAISLEVEETDAGASSGRGGEGQTADLSFPHKYIHIYHRLYSDLGLFFFFNFSYDW